jgi:hypothetical protein
VLDELADLQAMRKDSFPLKPTYRPHNDAAKRILSVIYNQLPSTPKSANSGKRRKQYSLVISSFLACSQRASVKDNGVVAIPEDNNYWSEFKNVGRQIAKNTTQELIALGFIEHVPNSGVRHIWQDDEGLWHSAGVVTQYTVDNSLLNLPDFVNATWIDVERVEVLISKPEKYLAKKAREARGERRAKIASKDIERVLGRRNYKKYIGVQKGVRKLNTYWQKHPLVLPPDGNGYSVHCASATRIFHNGRIDCGGRYYGDWSNLEGYVRRRATIDGEATVQIDCNASQLTLFSSLMGMKMRVGDRWTNTWDVIVEPLDGENKQAKAKQVTMELIGTGNSYKVAPAKDGDCTFSKDIMAIADPAVDDYSNQELNEYGVYRHRLLEVVPALKELDNDYYNGAGFLSFHESEIMRKTLSKLMSINITAYPMHDAIIVKSSQKQFAVDTYRTIFNNYVKEVSRKLSGNEVDIIIPMTIENSEGKVRLEGQYL